MEVFSDNMGATVFLKRPQWQGLCTIPSPRSAAGHVFWRLGGVARHLGRLKRLGNDVGKSNKTSGSGYFMIFLLESAIFRCELLVSGRVSPIINWVVVSI